MYDEALLQKQQHNQCYRRVHRKKSGLIQTKITSHITAFNTIALFSLIFILSGSVTLNSNIK